MHRRLNETYSSACCNHHIELDAGWYKKVKKAFRKAVKAIHEQRAFTPDSVNDKRILPLISETYRALKEGVNTGITTEVPAAMINKLNNDVFVFSGMKTYAQLKEASLLLRDANGQIKPFDAFARDIEQINSNYNQNYLRAEHQFAIGSAQAAAQWHEYAKDGDRYNLQIRTAGDDKVRASHQELNMITLPQSDPYWKTTYTPFDWGCRCRIIQVLKSKYPVTDAGTATMAADKAIPPLFRYNPGLQQTIFPPKHPYYPQHCNGEKLNVSGLIGFAKWLLDAEADRCKAMQIIAGMSKGGDKESQYRNKIYEKPIEEQYQTVFKSKTGKTVQTHQLANESREKYADIIYASKAMANNNISVKIQPEINVTDTEARRKIMPGYTHRSANPELLTEHGQYIDVKTPQVWKNINGLAVHAAKKQDAEALITDLKINIEPSKINNIATRIFMDKNYKKDAVHFVIKGKYYRVSRG